MVNTEGLDNAAVLAALYNNSRPLGIGSLHYTPEPLSVEEARRLLGHKTYFDYLNGRVMKVGLDRSDGFEEWGYDRDNGQGAAQRVVDRRRTAS